MTIKLADYLHLCDERYPQPFRVQLEESYSAVTNDQAMLLIRGDEGEPAPNAMKVILETELPHRATLDVEKMLSWLDKNEAPIVECVECGGSGKHGCDCEYCDEPCDFCEGKKHHEGATEVCFLPDINVNLRLLQRYVPVHEGTLRLLFASEKDPIKIIGDGWFAMVMPMRPSTNARHLPPGIVT